MLAAVSDEAQELERIYGEVARRRAAASEFLHGPIQSQLVASALKGETNEQALEAIEKRFAEYNASTSRWDVHEQVAALTDAWADVMTIRITCPPEMWQRLQREQLTARLLVDTLSEAVTNAVRHGEVADIDVTIDETDNRVRLTVSSLGTLTDGIGNGTGLARLVDRGARITLEQVHGRVVMQTLL
jgi:ribosomal protein L22